MLTFAILTQAAEAIAGEPQPEAVLKRLMSLILELVGVDRVLLFRQTAAGWQPVNRVESSSTSDSQQTMLPQLPIDLLDLDLLDQVLATQSAQMRSMPVSPTAGGAVPVAPHSLKISGCLPLRCREADLLYWEWQGTEAGTLDPEVLLDGVRSAAAPLDRHLDPHLDLRLDRHLDPRQGQAAITFLISQAQLAIERLPQYQLPELTQQLKRWQIAVSEVNGAVWEWDLHTHEAFRSDQWYRLLGYEPTDIPNTHAAWIELLHPEDHERMMIAQADYYAGKVNHEQLDYRIRCKDGSYRWFRSRARIETDESGMPVRLTGINFDLTELKAAEAALQQSQVRFQDVFNAARQMLGICTPQGRIISLNRAALQTIARPLTDLLDRPFWETPWMTGLPEAQQFRQAIQRAAQGEVCQFEGRLRTPTEALLIVEVSCRPLIDAAGQVDQILIEAHNITERKQTEVRLQTSQAQLATAHRLAQLGSWDYDVDTEINQFSPELCQILGLDAVAGRYDRGSILARIVHPQDRDRLWAVVQQAIDQGTSYEVEHRIRRPDGVVRYVVSRGEACCDAAGRTRKLIGTVQDITEYRQASLLLQQQEAQLRLTLDLTNIATWRWVPGQENDTCLRSGAQLLGQPDTAQLSYSHWRDAIHQEDRLWVEQALYQAAEAQTDLCCEYRVVWPDGSLHWLEMKGRSVKNEVDNFDEMLGVLIDITRRKESELALQASEMRYWEIVENQTDLICRYLPDGTLTFVNDVYCQYFGRSRQSLIGQSFMPLIPPEDYDQINDLFAQLSADHPIVHCEHQVILPNGERRWQSWIDRAIYDAAGHLLEFQAVGRDITDRKQLEATLREREAFLSTIYDGVGVNIFVVEQTPDQDFLHVDVNSAFEQVFEIRRDRIVGRKLSDLTNVLSPERVSVLALRYRCCFSTHQGLEFEEQVFLNGQETWWLTRLTPVISEGRVRQVIGSSVSITDRKRLEAEICRFNQELEQRVHQRTEELLVAQIALQQSEQFLRSIYEGVDYPIFVMDVMEVMDSVDFRQVSWNPACERMIGQSNLEAHGKLLSEIILDPIDLQQMLAFFQRCLDLNTMISQEVCQTLHNETRWFITTLNPLRNRDGKIYRLVGTAFEITERKQNEAALQESEERFRQLAENIESVFWITTVDRDRLLYISPGYEKIWQRPSESLYTPLSTGLQFIYPDDRSRVHQQFSDQWTGEYDCEYRILRPNGEIRWIRDRAFPIKNQQGDIYRIAGIAEDITERKQAEAELQQTYLELEQRVEERTAELRQAKEAAESASRSKSTFLANMSHELRTPLNAILGFSQLMARDNCLNPAQQQQLNIINRNGEHLLTLINDILEMSKIEAGRASLNLNTFDLHYLLQSLEEMFQLKAGLKSVDLQVWRSPNVPQFIRADESKLRQVLINLLSNGIKFTSSGHVILRIAILPQAHADLSAAPGMDGSIDSPRHLDLDPPVQTEPLPSLCWSKDQPTVALPDASTSLPIAIVLNFEVTDTGIGIAPDDQTLLFSPFVQTEMGRKAQEGTGLGLAISHQFVRLMGGELTVESVFGQGSTFRFAIPVERVNAPIYPLNQPQKQVLGLLPSQPQYRILVVEDNWANRQLLVDLLQLLGFAVQSAQNGLEAVERWRDWQPHLIWMDIRMPELDGYEATQRIRAEFAQSAAQRLKPVIIALTASAFEEERLAILSAGCDDFVRKPVKEQTLLEKIAQHLGVQYCYQDASLSPLPGALHPSLTPEQLTVMPPEWIAELHRAAQIADEEIILQLVKQIPEPQQPLIETLKTLVHHFQLEQIIEATAALVDKSMEI